MALLAFPAPTLLDRLRRLAFAATWLLLCRFSPVPLHGWRRVILRLFGAAIGAGVHVYPSAVIWAPWNLEIRRGGCLGPGVVCYNVAQITLDEDALVSQRAHLCTASHDFNSTAFELVAAPILIGFRAWVCTEAYVGPGVSIGRGAVVGARCVVVKSVAELDIVVGNPAKVVGSRGSRPKP